MTIQLPSHEKRIDSDGITLGHTWWWIRFDVPVLRVVEEVYLKSVQTGVEHEEHDGCTNGPPAVCVHMWTEKRYVVRKLFQAVSCHPSIVKRFPGHSPRTE